MSIWIKWKRGIRIQVCGALELFCLSSNDYTIVSCMSTSKTMSIIQDCISFYMKVHLSSLQVQRGFETRWENPSNSIESKASLRIKNPKPKNLVVFSQQESFLDPAHVDRDSSTAKICNFQLLSPSRLPRPLPLINANILPEDSPDDKQTIGKVSEEANHVKSIFKPLKSYIRTCFSQSNCLNSSFLVPKVPYLRATSEVIASTPKFWSDLTSWTHTEKIPSEQYAKMWLIEDLAENGNWWVGSAHVGRSATSTIFKKPPERASAAIVSSKTPRIHWEELSEWYHVVLSAGCTWKGVLGKIEINSAIGGIQKPFEISAEEE